ncbi:MAG: hypothetical protein GX466_08780 [Candidatus Cloacimonetes bacterium]|nr:hypothetical protein [Candidatus Cloacimonadota bacterium]
MKLTPEQIHSAGWVVVKAHAAERLLILRARLESELSHDDTLKTRASIRELKQLLDLETQEQELETNG